jgi:[glutamine synthetase] adenylyltransferase / [glutamine synthetase]-adenylyl-L-tyrosine phosphorylase
MPPPHTDHFVRVLSPESTGLATATAGTAELLEDAISRSPDPERVRRYFNEFVKCEPKLFEQLASDEEYLVWLAAIFSSSRFLSEELLRHADWIFDIDSLPCQLTRDQYSERLAAFLKSSDSDQPPAAKIALFRRKELLRIVLRDQLHIGMVSEITEELSNLADAILAHAFREVTSELVPRFGQPIEETTAQPATFAILAVGKLGGRELNYSSDIDLIFLYSANGETSGPQRITNKEFFKKVANELTNLLSAYTPAGQCYRIDLRLRPEGSHGEVCISLAAAKEYYAKRARDWELQMLLKARVAAGDERLGQDLLETVEPLIYSTTLDFSTVETMSATRERIGEKIRRKSARRNEIDVKLTRGGIRDIEFLVQCLQRLHGNRESSIKDQGTLSALARLHQSDLLSTTEFSRLAHAYRFLRKLEHVLQFEDDRQTHALPSDAAGLETIARRIAQPSSDRRPDIPASTHLIKELNQHLENVQTIYERIVHAQRPLYYTSPLTHGPLWEAPARIEDLPENEKEKDLFSRIKSAAPQLIERIRAYGNRSLRNGISDFLEKLLSCPAELKLLSEHSVLAAWTMQLFELSPLLASQLTRNPELLEQIRKAADHPGRRYAFEGLSAPLNDIEGLRRFFRREMFRIQTASVCLPEPVFQTLDQTSALAEFVIARAYRIALEMGLEHARNHASTAKPFEEPQSEMMVVALGRLGMREFDLGSDADLLFIIPDIEASKQRFWTRVVERLLEILSSYTEGGPILSVDTRLRPNGREGMLVQSESKYVEYFSNKAETWEGIAYMKARAVAGDTDRATKFLTQLQQVDWRRYGQGGRSKLDLRQMRLRLQREQGSNAPLKAAQGGYYDADFILMYLRLRGAGMFFKSLNTPERIDIVEKMGHLERADAEFLLEATTHFRALDHALRLVTGHAEGKIPGSAEQRENIAELMNRWTTQQSTGESLETDLVALQTRMHRLFETVFTQ